MESPYTVNTQDIWGGSEWTHLHVGVIGSPSMLASRLEPLGGSGELELEVARSCSMASLAVHKN